MTIPGYYLFLFPLLSLSLRISDMLRIGFSWLCIPLAIYLAHRYRWQGVATAAVGGLLLPFGLQLNSEFSAFPIDLDVYLIMVGAAVLTVKGQNISRVKAWLHSPYLYSLALIIIPLNAKRITIHLSVDITIQAGFYLLAVLFFILFLQGTAGVSARMVISGLLLATVAGFLTDVFGLPFSYDYATSSNRPAFFPVYYSLNNLNDFLVGTACYYVGRYYGKLTGEGRKPAVSGTLLWLGTAALIALWLGKTYGLPIWGRYLKFSSFYIVPAASMFLGMAFRSKGTVWAVIIALLSVFTGYITKTSGIYFDEFLYAMAFGVLGILLYDQATGERTVWSPCGLYAGAWLPFLAAIGFAFIEEDSPISVCLLIVTLILLVIATILAIPLLRARLHGFKSGKIVERWLSMATVATLTGSVVSRIKEVVSKVAEGLDNFKQILSLRFGDMFDSRQFHSGSGSIDLESIGISMLLLFYFAFLLSLFIYLIRSYENIMTDLHRLLHRSAALAGKLLEKTRRNLAMKFAELAARLEHSKWLLTPRMQKVLTVSVTVAGQVRNLLFAMLLIGTFLLIELMSELM